MVSIKGERLSLYHIYTIYIYICKRKRNPSSGGCALLLLLLILVVPLRWWFSKYIHVCMCSSGVVIWSLYGFFTCARLRDPMTHSMRSRGAAHELAFVSSGAVWFAVCREWRHGDWIEYMYTVTHLIHRVSVWVCVCALRVFTYKVWFACTARWYRFLSFCLRRDTYIWDGWNESGAHGNILFFLNIFPSKRKWHDINAKDARGTDGRGGNSEHAVRWEKVCEATARCGWSGFEYSDTYIYDTHTRTFMWVCFGLKYLFGIGALIWTLFGVYCYTIVWLVFPWKWWCLGFPPRAVVFISHTLAIVIILQLESIDIGDGLMYTIWRERKIRLTNWKVSTSINFDE